MTIERMRTMMKMVTRRREKMSKRTLWKLIMAMNQKTLPMSLRRMMKKAY